MAVVIVAFAWGPFWGGFVVGMVFLVVAAIMIMELIDPDLKRERQVRRRLDQEARQARDSLYRDRVEEVREELKREERLKLVKLEKEKKP